MCSNRIGRTARDPRAVFEHWQSSPASPTLRLVDRSVYVDMYRAMPDCVGGLGVMGKINLSVKSEGLRLEHWMRGRQIAWIRTDHDRWVGIVIVDAHSTNGLSSVTMTLWLPPGAFQLDQPEDWYTREMAPWIGPRASTGPGI